ncbi:BapA/Bap/LapF family prefix-like domain-containing protein [Pseudooceanicola aestuarii]|uniref:BapA/Bap/LapF family prefix-like domain-containing protein n=1 Tax=Pseudooceanicola aestuarii TaxID=2697319 RepID=UPI0013D0A404|nr:hypothetical protein [Pseudooceanicola aestuarii]
MVEIFTIGREDGDAPARQEGTEVSLPGPSDVYFSPAAPGIAFYQKTGADLTVTLLDGTEVRIADFFVIGADGSYNRLLDGPAGQEEISGLVAPEPLRPVTEMAEAIVVEETPPATAEDSATADEEFPTTPPADTVAQGDVIDVGYTPSTPEATGDLPPVEAASGGGSFFGAGSDQLLFGVAGVGVTGLLYNEWVDDDDGGSQTASAASTTAIAMDPEVAVLLGEASEDDTDLSALTESGAPETQEFAPSATGSDSTGDAGAILSDQPGGDDPGAGSFDLIAGGMLDGLVGTADVL